MGLSFHFDSMNSRHKEVNEKKFCMMGKRTTWISKEQRRPRLMVV